MVGYKLYNLLNNFQSIECDLFIFNFAEYYLYEIKYKLKYI